MKLRALRAPLLHALPIVLLHAAIAAGPARAQNPTIDITPGRLDVFRAAVQLFDDRVTPASAERAGRLRDEIEEGLRYSSLLMPLDHEAFLGDEKSSSLDLPNRTDCGDWAQSGADALVEGEIRREEGRMVAEFRVWDTARCVRLVRGRFRRPPSEIARLGREVADDVIAAFTGKRGVSSTEIAFVSDRTGVREVYVMNADGSDQRKATAGQRIKAFPAWLPDGESILYTSYLDGKLPGLFITSRGAAKPGPILTDVLPGIPKYRGVFDPTGEYLAMVASVDSATEIFVVSRNGKRLDRLTNNPAIEVGPTWSPDGSALAFVSDRTGSPQVYVMDRDGGNVRRLTFEGSYNTAPTWSPDGRWIAYESRIGGQFDIWLVDPSGQINIPLISHPESDESPNWSPDGRKLVFSSKRRGRADLYVVDWNGENVMRLTKGQGDNMHPAWGPYPR